MKKEFESLNALEHKKRILDEQIQAAKEKRREKRYVEASKLTLFLVVGIVILAFFVADFIALKLLDSSAATENLRILTAWAQIVLVAIIAKSGFENMSKGRIRRDIVRSKIRHGEEISGEAEDFRNNV